MEAREVIHPPFTPRASWLIQIRRFCLDRGLGVVQLPQGLVLGGRFLAIPDEPLDALRLAWDLRDKPGRAVAYTDGSGTVFDKPAGSGCVVLHADGKLVEVARGIGPGTNNMAELSAVRFGLWEIPDLDRQVVVRTDSEYTMGSLTKDWHANKNKELIADIRSELSLRGGRVQFEHVRGHAGVAGNERADQLAKEGRLLQNARRTFLGMLPAGRDMNDVFEWEGW